MQAIQEIETLLHFRLLGIDTDNGSEFLNAHLIRYRREHHIQFTRSRPYRKNDNCFVEQKIETGNSARTSRSTHIYGWTCGRHIRITRPLRTEVRVNGSTIQVIAFDADVCCA